MPAVQHVIIQQNFLDISARMYININIIRLSPRIRPSTAIYLTLHSAGNINQHQKHQPNQILHIFIFTIKQHCESAALLRVAQGKGRNSSKVPGHYCLIGNSLRLRFDKHLKCNHIGATT